jgi:hypothetical protein
MPMGVVTMGSQLASEVLGGKTSITRRMRGPGFIKFQPIQKTPPRTRISPASIVQIRWTV